MKLEGKVKETAIFCRMPTRSMEKSGKNGVLKVGDLDLLFAFS